MGDNGWDRFPLEFQRRCGDECLCGLEVQEIDDLDLVAVREVACQFLVAMVEAQTGDLPSVKPVAEYLFAGGGAPDFQLTGRAVGSKELVR